MSTKKEKKRLVLLDAHAILHRGYHALPEFASSKGEPTGALYGLSAILIKLVAEIKPDHIAACFDMPGPTFRHEAYEEYKAKRPKAEDDLIHQMKRARDIFEAFSIPIYQKAGFEADDVIGTVTHQMEERLKAGDVEIIIASGDMDTLQLVSGTLVRVYTLKKGINDTILYDEKAVRERFGFGPELLPDYKGLRGDPSDNIPGVPGIGEKTATALISAFGTVEDIYKKLRKDEGAFEKKGIKKRAVELLKENEEEALFSKTLASIRVDVPIMFKFPTGTWRKSVQISKLETLFRELEFRTLLVRAKKLFEESETGEAPKTEEAASGQDKDALARLGIGVWLLNSELTSPAIDDIFHETGKQTLPEAEAYIKEELKKRGLDRLYEEIELPLVPILKRAEERGVAIDTAFLKNLSKKYHGELENLEHKIFKEAGAEFNINSPKQLGEILFERLELSTKGLKKTEGGARSTRESELLKLRREHAIIDVILEYRELQKLLSTYIDNIPGMIAIDGRLHTTFLQTGTTTGRISSANPNLQNIPIKTARGREIRKAFVADSGHVLAAFDYSQIELRALAMLSKDKDFVQVFNGGRDIHSAVAAHVFGVSEQNVTQEMRRKAKVINFGIIYGMGIVSLQKALGGTRPEAQVFYDNYFNEFPGVAEYIAEVKKEAVRRGYTTTLFGRRRYFKGINSPIPYVRSAAERMAINAPIQGTATGDIIKLAIIKADERLRREGFSNKATLLLQVHDELIYEIRREAAGRAVPIIKETMEQVIAHTKEGALVPLGVVAKVGESWGEI